MPRQKRLHAYPPLFEETLRRAHKNSIEIPCLTQVEVRNLRNQFYAYRKSLYLESDNRALILLVEGLFFRVVGCTLIIQRKRGASQILAQALENEEEETHL